MLWLGLAAGSAFVPHWSDVIRRRKLPINIGTAVQLLALLALLYIPGLGAAACMALCFIFGYRNTATRNDLIALTTANKGRFAMTFPRIAVAAPALFLALAATVGVARAADLPVKAAKPVADAPFFLVNDNQVSYSYIFSGTDPGVYSTNPDGTINGKTPKQVATFTHLDVWAYGTNFFNISMYKSGQNDPASPCTNAGEITNPTAGFTTVPANCAGATEIYGFFRSTFGFNEIFNTKTFTVGPLRDLSFLVGADANTENNYLAPAKRDVVAGLQFAFDLPYKGFFNVAPLYYKETNHNAFLQCGAGWNLNIPGLTCLADGNTNYRGTWAVETTYSMDLGFLPPFMQYFSISGRAAWYGPKGPENSPLTDLQVRDRAFALGGAQTVTEFNSEPIRLTFDASKLMWGSKYSHFLDVWVAYRYWQNKFGLDHTNSTVCNVSPGVSNNSCTESSLYSGISLKF
jgi:hypothetical protein